MKTQLVGVVDYGAGNIFSVLRALKATGFQPIILKNNKKIKKCGHIILPGVAAFGVGIKNLHKIGLIDPLKEHVKQGKPLLGLCLGSQLLMDWSEEFGFHKGIGLIRGCVKKIPRKEDLRIPHVGWAPIKKTQSWENTPLERISQKKFVYFTHSLTCHLEEDINLLASFEYGGRTLTAGIRKENIFGLQFHPELSSDTGLKIFSNFKKI